MTYDPAFMNTASCRSAITFIDGDKGILRYRGYPIEQLAEKCTFLEVAYLLLNGELPTPTQLDEWVHEITHHTMLHENIKKFMDGFRYDAHPMGMLVSTVAALSTFYPEAKNIHDPEIRQLQILPADRQDADHRGLRLPPQPRPALRLSGQRPQLHRELPEHAVEDDGAEVHGRTRCWRGRSTCSSSCTPTTSRTAAPTPCARSAARRPIPYRRRPRRPRRRSPARCTAAPTRKCCSMLDEIGSKDNIPAFIEKVKAGQVQADGLRPPRLQELRPARPIIKQTADEVFEVTGRNPKLDIALELERIALEDEYFVKRKLYPNVDFYSGIIYQAMGFTPDMFTVLFAIPRTAGWLAQWQEMLQRSRAEDRPAAPASLHTGAAGARRLR